MSNKEFGKIIVLVTIVVVGMIYGYFALLMLPLNAACAEFERKQYALDAVIQTRVAELQKLAASARIEHRKEPLNRLSKRLLETVPKTPLLICPTVFANAFQARGMKKPKANLEFVMPFPTTTEILFHGWSVTLPEAHALAMGEAIADLENYWPMAQITALSMEGNPENEDVKGIVTLKIAVER